MNLLNKDERFTVNAIFYIYFLIGIYALAVGTMVPLMREEYGFSYEMSGFLLSVNSAGSLVMSLVASYTAIFFGLRKAYAIQHTFVIVGLIILVVAEHPAFLMTGIALIGMARGSAANYSMQIVNDITKSNSRVIGLLTVFYAAGACLIPVFVLFCITALGSWKYACIVIAAASAAGILMTLKMKIETVGGNSNAEKRGDYSFFKRIKFCLPLILLFFYMGFEVSVVGWIVTYYTEVHHVSDRLASSMASMLWVTMLVGRIICSILAGRVKKSEMIMYLSIGLVISSVFFVFSTSTGLLIAATIGIGMFMSGYYSIVVADAGHVFSEYRLAFGYFVMLSGLGSVIMPSLIGVVAERQGVQAGIKILAAVAVILIVLAFWNVRTDKKNEKALSETCDIPGPAN